MLRYNEGISDIKGKVTLEGEPKVVYKSDALGIETTLHRLSVDRGLSWKDAKTIYDKARAEEAAARRLSGGGGDEDGEGDTEDDEEEGKQTGFYRSRTKVFGEFIHLLAIEKKVQLRSKAVISRPNTGTNKNDQYWSDILRKYVRYDDSDLERAERDWNAEYARGAAAGAKVKRAYGVGVLTGSVTPFWSTLEKLMSDFPELGHSQADSQLQVVRIELEDSRRIVGVKWPIQLAEEVGPRLATAAAGKEAGARPVEAPAPVEPKSVKRAGQKAQSLHNFFAAAPRRESVAEADGGAPMAMDDAEAAAGAAAAGGEAAEVAHGIWTCSKCTLENAPERKKCEVCKHPRAGGASAAVTSPFGAATAAAAPRRSSSSAGGRGGVGRGRKGGRGKAAKGKQSGQQGLSMFFGNKVNSQ